MSEIRINQEAGAHSPNLHLPDNDGDYIVIVARIDDGRVIFARPGVTMCGPGPLPRGKEAAEFQFKTGLRAVDRFAERGGKGESLTAFLERFR